jgi:hypothetical protein
VKLRLTEREYARERAQFRNGTHGPASDVRKIDVASVDAPALLEQLAKRSKRGTRRSPRYALPDRSR